MLSCPSPGQKETLMQPIIRLTAVAAVLAVALVALGAGSSQQPESRKDIVDTAVAAGQFKTLAAALKAGALVETLKSEGPFTVFAPTDEAFAKLPKSALEDLLKPQNKDKLVAILTYHVVPASATSSDVANMKSAK